MPCVTWCAPVAVGGGCRSTSGLGRRSTVGFESWRGAFLFQTIHDVTLLLDRRRTGREAILEGIRKRGSRVKHLFADGAYDRLKLMDKAAYLDLVIEVIRRSDDQKGFQVLPRRWVVKRTFGWMTCWRRLVRDYEQRIDVSHAMILVAMGGNLLRRTARP